MSGLRLVGPHIVVGLLSNYTEHLKQQIEGPTSRFNPPGSSSDARNDSHHSTSNPYWGWLQAKLILHLHLVNAARNQVISLHRQPLGFLMKHASATAPAGKVRKHRRICIHFTYLRIIQLQTLIRFYCSRNLHKLHFPAVDWSMKPHWCTNCVEVFRILLCRAHCMCIAQLSGTRYSQRSHVQIHKEEIRYCACANFFILAISTNRYSTKWWCHSWSQPSSYGSNDRDCILQVM